MEDYGRYQSAQKGSDIFATTQIDYETVCPFGSGAPNEDETGKQYFSEKCKHNEQLGYSSGHVNKSDFRKQGSSDILSIQALTERLSKGLVDCVLYVKSENAELSLRTTPSKCLVNVTLDETQKGGKSRYYPIELSEVLEEVKFKRGCYVVVDC